MLAPCECCHALSSAVCCAAHGVCGAEAPLAAGVPRAGPRLLRAAARRPGALLPQREDLHQLLQQHGHGPQHQHHLRLEALHVRGLRPLALQQVSPTTLNTAGFSGALCHCAELHRSLDKDTPMLTDDTYQQAAQSIAHILAGSRHHAPFVSCFHGRIVRLQVD